MNRRQFLILTTAAALFPAAAVARPPKAPDVPPPPPSPLEKLRPVAPEQIQWITGFSDGTHCTFENDRTKP